MSTIFGTDSPISLEMLLIIVLGIVSLILVIIVYTQHRRINNLVKGKGAVSIEDSLLVLSKEVKDLLEFRKGSEEYLTTVERRLRNSVQAVDTIRFNAFKGNGSGGNQSFATAFINEHGDGLVVSTLYSSDRMSIFAKPIAKFNSQFELTDEEKAVLKGATHRLTK